MGQFGYHKEPYGHYLLGHRFYDAGMGRFVTRDPIGYKGGINLYGFTGNNPVNESDPSGYSPAGDFAGVVGLVPGPIGEAANLASGLDSLHEGDYLGAALSLGGEVPGLGEIATGAKILRAANRIRKAERAAKDAERGVEEVAVAIKRGPKPAGTGPHNAKIAERIQQLKMDHHDWIHEGGGDRTEETIKTPGGFKSSRRPDITFRRPDGSFYRENVGKTFRNGSPIRREQRALNDLERQLGTRPAFTPYDR